MHIPGPKQSCANNAADLREQLQSLIDQPEPEAVAPCPACRLGVRSDCSPSCQNAPMALSIEPERYPVERYVVGLVFELMATRMIQTCWSCEGHMDDQNELWKMPQVCFYVVAPIYVKLLHRHLVSLYQSKQLAYRWHIVITDFASTAGLTYSIQPDLNKVSSPRLGLMQQDLTIIAADLHGSLKDYARELLATLC